MNRELVELEKKATEVFLKKPYWAQKYNNAPEGAKEYYRLVFAYSVCGTANGDGSCSLANIQEEKKRIYRAMNDESWNYIMKNATHAEAQGLYIARLKMKEENYKT